MKTGEAFIHLLYDVEEVAQDINKTTLAEQVAFQERFSEYVTADAL